MSAMTTWEGRTSPGRPTEQETERGEEATKSGPSMLIAVGWFAVAITAVLVGWGRDNRILIAVGALMIIVAAWNALVYFIVRDS